MKKAIGDADEAKALGPMMDQVRENFRKLGDEDVYKGSEAERGIDGYVVDKGFRKKDRDESGPAKGRKSGQTLKNKLGKTGSKDPLRVFLQLR